jgi:lambda family phage portal protein
MLETLRRALFNRKPEKSLRSDISTRAYDSAAGGRRWRDAGATPSIQAAVLAGREPVARRARDSSINQPLASSAVEVWCGEAIGTGMRPVPQTGDDALDKILADRFEAWTDECDYFGLESFYGWQSTAARRAFVDGEFFSLMVFEGEQLRIKPLDPAQVNPALSLELPNGGLVIAGVEVNEGGKPIAFHIYRNWIPGLPLLRGLESVRIDAADVLHLFRPDAAGQTRGMSRLASVLLRLRELDSLTDGQLVRLKIGALLAGFVTDADGTLLQDGATPGEASLEPGTMQRLRPGESVEFSKPPEIGSESNAFQKAVIREIGAGVGVPSFMLDHDLSEVNFSSARTAIIAFRRRVEAWQDHFAFQMLRPVYRRFVTTEILSGRLAVPLNASTLRHKWIAPKGQWLDPLKDAQAEALAINSGLTSRREAVAARGIDVESLDNEIAADRAREERLGLSFAAPPQQTGVQDNVA